MAKYLVVDGRHFEFGESYKKGDIVESESKLDELFKGKFIKQADTASAQKKEEEPEPEPEEETEEEEVDENALTIEELAEVESDLGVNITDEFENVQEAQLCIFKKGKEFHVATPDNPKKSLSTNKMTTRKAVDKFVSRFV